MDIGSIGGVSYDSGTTATVSDNIELNGTIDFTLISASNILMINIGDSYSFNGNYNRIVLPRKDSNYKGALIRESDMITVEF